MSEQENNQKSGMDVITLARTGLLFKHPFFAHLAMKLNIVEVGDQEKASGFKTAAVDGKNLYFHDEFVKSLSHSENMFLVAHEVMHCAFSHITRRFDRDPQLWNMATDYVINATLVEAGLEMPKIGLHDSKYLGWSADDVYQDLLQNDVNPQETLDHHAGDPAFPGQDKDGEGKPKKGENGDTKGKGGTENGDGSNLSEEDLKELEEEWKNNLVEAATAVGAGNVPASIQRMIDDLLNPKLSWREFLEITLQSCIRNDYTWMRPNKRTFGDGITIPSMDMDDHIQIAIAIDTSGSVTPDMLVDFLSEVKGIMDSFSSYDIHIACFDTEVYNPQTFNEEEDILNYEMQGFGGTDFMAWWNWAMEQDWYGDVQKVIFFTDGMPHGSWAPPENDCPDTLWIIHGTKNEGPHGTTVYYDDHHRDE